MAGEAAAQRFDEDDFYCPVCQEVFKTPVRTANCQHVWVSLRFISLPSFSIPPPPSSPVFRQRPEVRQVDKGSVRGWLLLRCPQHFGALFVPSPFAFPTGAWVSYALFPFVRSWWKSTPFQRNV